MPGVARAVVPVVVAYATPTGRTGPRFRRASLLIAAPSGPDGRRQPPHDARTLPFVQGRVGRAELQAEAEGPIEVPFPTVRAN